MRQSGREATQRAEIKRGLRCMQAEAHTPSHAATQLIVPECAQAIHPCYPPTLRKASPQPDAAALLAGAGTPAGAVVAAALLAVPKARAGALAAAGAAPKPKLMPPAEETAGAPKLKLGAAAAEEASPVRLMNEGAGAASAAPAIVAAGVPKLNLGAAAPTGLAVASASLAAASLASWAAEGSKQGGEGAMLRRETKRGSRQAVWRQQGSKPRCGA
jgi:hypothetical protein